jgi:hypothetical protein
MKAGWLAVLASCGGASATRPPPSEPEPVSAALADEDLYRPTYGRAELQKALIAERAAEAVAERRVGEAEAKAADAAEGIFTPPRSERGMAPIGRAAATPADDALRVVLGDLAVRRRFIATLEACQAAGRWCPPRLDDPAWSFDPDPERPTDPPMSTALRFDLDSWRNLANELHGRACACRTVACVDSVGVAIDLLERRPMGHVQIDDAATASIVWARGCLARLRGAVPIVTAAPPEG